MTDEGKIQRRRVLADLLFVAGALTSAAVLASLVTEQTDREVEFPIPRPPANDRCRPSGLIGNIGG